MDNKYIQHGFHLLVMIVKIRKNLIEKTAKTLRKDILIALKKFEFELSKGGEMNTSEILAARFTLCAAIDEAILNTNWGMKSKWHKNTLLYSLHKNTTGGNNFYLIINHYLESNTHHDLILFLYLLLQLGYKGIYYENPTIIEKYKIKMYRELDNHKSCDIQKNKRFFTKRNIYIILFITIFFTAFFYINTLISTQIFNTKKNLQSLIKELNH